MIWGSIPHNDTQDPLGVPRVPSGVTGVEGFRFWGSFKGSFRSFKGFGVRAYSGLFRV